jgi:hypothetical protein
LPSFHHDHIVVREAEAQRCLAALQQFIDRQSKPTGI